MIRVAVIGTGHGAAVQVPAFQAHPDTHVVAIVSARRERADAAAAAFGIADAYTDYRAVLDRPDVDMVSIATPPSLHCEMAIEALQAGKHVVCEKPLAATYEEARRMEQAARGQPHLLAVSGFMYRYVPARQHMHRLIAGGALGEPIFALISNVAWGGSHAWNTQPAWLWDADAGGGFLGVAGPHSIDNARNWFGEVRRVAGWTRAVLRERTNPDTGQTHPVTAEDTFSVWVEFQNRVSVQITSSMAAGIDRGLQVEIHGTAGALVLDGKNQLRAARENGAFEPVALPPDLERPDLVALSRQAQTKTGAYGIGSFLRLIDHMVGVLERGEDRAGLPTFEDGARVQQVLDAARTAAREGCWMELPSTR